MIVKSDDVGAGVGSGVGAGVGAGVGSGVGAGVGADVGTGVGSDAIACWSGVGGDMDNIINWMRGAIAYYEKGFQPVI